MKYLIFLSMVIFGSCVGDLPENIGLPRITGASDARLLPEKGLAKDYWYKGQGEITKFQLSQNRYRDVHPGELLQIFVTEDFLTDKQVKNDYYQSQNSISVLKMNQIRRFTTGLYDYSMMLSVFSPADGSPVQKITFSSQDWCGQSFMQINRSGKTYQVQLHSYFESEGDQRISVSADMLEDEILNKIRIHPQGLPTGKLDLLPSAAYMRLAHLPIRSYPAELALNKEDDRMVYSIRYPDLSRDLEITFEAKPPHRITQMSETYPSAFDKKSRTTRAIPVGEIKESYWKLNAVSDTSARKALHLRGYTP